MGLLDALVPDRDAFAAMLENLTSDTSLTGVLGAPKVVRTGSAFFLNLFKRADVFDTLYSQILYGPIENLGGYVSQPLVRFVLYNWKLLHTSFKEALLNYFPHSLTWLDNNLYEFVPGLPAPKSPTGLNPYWTYVVWGSAEVAPTLLAHDI